MAEGLSLNDEALERLLAAATEQDWLGVSHLLTTDPPRIDNYSQQQQYVDMNFSGGMPFNNQGPTMDGGGVMRARRRHSALPDMISANAAMALLQQEQKVTDSLAVRNTYMGMHRNTYSPAPSPQLQHQAYSPSMSPKPQPRHLGQMSQIHATSTPALTRLGLNTNVSPNLQPASRQPSGLAPGPPPSYLSRRRHSALPDLTSARSTGAPPLLPTMDEIGPPPHASYDDLPHPSLQHRNSHGRLQQNSFPHAHTQDGGGVQGQKGIANSQHRPSPPQPQQFGNNRQGGSFPNSQGSQGSYQSGSGGMEGFQNSQVGGFGPPASYLQQRRHSALPGLLSYMPPSQANSLPNVHELEHGMFEALVQDVLPETFVGNFAGLSVQTENAADLDDLSLAEQLVDMAEFSLSQQSSHQSLADSKMEFGSSYGTLDDIVMNGGPRAQRNPKMEDEGTAERTCEHCSRPARNWCLYPGTKVILCVECFEYIEKAAQGVSASDPAQGPPQARPVDSTPDTDQTPGVMQRKKPGRESARKQQARTEQAEEEERGEEEVKEKGKPKKTKGAGSKKKAELKPGTECANCKTKLTTLWRRSESGQLVCNACGLYERLHKCPRPTSIFHHNTMIRKRNRKKRTPKDAANGEGPPDDYFENRRHSAPNILGYDNDRMG